MQPPGDSLQVAKPAPIAPPRESPDLGSTGEAFPDLDLPDHTDSDPFARRFDGTVVEYWLFSAVQPPPGPPIERYAGAPWPGGRFDPGP